MVRPKGHVDVVGRVASAMMCRCFTLSQRTEMTMKQERPSAQLDTNA